MHTRRAGSLLGIDGFDIFTLGQCALMAAQTTLGKLVNALVGRRAARLDHVQNATLVRRQTHYFARNGTTEGHAGAQFLQPAQTHVTF
jgi:hypothetical protein